MKQQSVAEHAFTKQPKATKRQQFLAGIDEVVPWERLCSVIEPFYPTGTSRNPFFHKTPLISINRLHAHGG
ncbi:hypothetical protein IGB42_03402 [Andreprevotia sp. IGB-42]|uniref:hypothetical protein n=1 Tax=Andreprevotia sp. IGB-42 TaxID=2497473 RepID=UPI00135C0157|nr:hypothetical protein [Andreprevotia sp. IGB-42]KAF0812125.1 hypothetical protein IGB42_03402 [Andreprevotia sp. IGB-42]